MDKCIRARDTSIHRITPLYFVNKLDRVVYIISSFALWPRKRHVSYMLYLLLNLVEICKFLYRTLMQKFMQKKNIVGVRISLLKFGVWII